MTTAEGRSIAPALIDSLYADALLLADEARDWFERARGDTGFGHEQKPAPPPPDGVDPLFAWAGRNDPSLRIALSCESLRLTTRLMHIISWLLMQRAIANGEMSPATARSDHRLGPSPSGDPLATAKLPDVAQEMIDRSIRLYERVEGFDKAWAETIDAAPAIHDLQKRLAAAF
jgi:regulator of CtrA degradation